MWCTKCDKHISQCKCPDIGDRLKAATKTGRFAYKKCTVCGKHYELCKCQNPQWAIEIRQPPMADVINIMEENA